MFQWLEKLVRSPSPISSDRNVTDLAGPGPVFYPLQAVLHLATHLPHWCRHQELLDLSVRLEDWQMATRLALHEHKYNEVSGTVKPVFEGYSDERALFDQGMSYVPIFSKLRYLSDGGTPVILGQFLSDIEVSSEYRFHYITVQYSSPIQQIEGY